MTQANTPPPRPNPALLITGIAPRARGDGTRGFVVLATSGGVAREVPVSAGDLLSYERFQAALLGATGLLWRLHIAEGRAPEFSDYFFREFVQFKLEDSAARPAPPAAAGPAN